jgi:isocitrate/isopropylmalate dehydrogenase
VDDGRGEDHRPRYDAPVTQKKLAVIGGDGIGPEVVAEGLKVLEAVAGPDAFETTPYDLGAAHWQRTGEVLSDETMAELAGADVILLGAVGASPGAKDVPSGLLERGLLLKLRFAFDHYVNLRPSRLFPGVPTPLADSVVAGREVDFVVVREGTEGLYCGNGGTFRGGTPHEIGTEVSINTAYGVERVVRDAFERASRRRNKLTLVHKHNVLVYAGGLWRRVFESVAAEYPQVSTDYLHVDAATIFLATDPARFDVIVTDNLSPTWRPRSPEASGWRPAGTSTRPGPSPRCSSRCTAPRPTSPGRVWPTRPPRSCRWLCCSSTSVSWTRRRAWRRPSWPTSRRARRGRSGRPPRSATRSPRGSEAGTQQRLTWSPSVRREPGRAGSGAGRRAGLDDLRYEDVGDDRVLLAGAAPGLAGGVVVTVFCDVPRVRVHLVHAMSCARRACSLQRY